MFLLYTFISIRCFFCNDPATTEIYTYCHPLSLHDSLPICRLAEHQKLDAAIALLAGDIEDERVGIGEAARLLGLEQRQRGAELAEIELAAEIGRAHV